MWSTTVQLVWHNFVYYIWEVVQKDLFHSETTFIVIYLMQQGIHPTMDTKQQHDTLGPIDYHAGVTRNSHK